MEARFHHWIKNKKGNCDFLSHNSDFFFSWLRDIVIIAGEKSQNYDFLFILRIFLKLNFYFIFL